MPGRRKIKFSQTVSTHLLESLVNREHSFVQLALRVRLKSCARGNGRAIRMSPDVPWDRWIAAKAYAVNTYGYVPGESWGRVSYLSRADTHNSRKIKIWKHIISSCHIRDLSIKRHFLCFLYNSLTVMNKKVWGSMRTFPCADYIYVCSLSFHM